MALFFITMKKLPINYNRDLPLAVVSDNPLTFIHLAKLFDRLNILTTAKRKWHSSGITDAEFTILPLKKSGPSNMVRSSRLSEFAKKSPKTLFATYSPIDAPYKINPLSLVMNSPTLTHAYENKRYFREEFADSIRMPRYTIKPITQLDKAAAYKEIKQELGEVFVMQDEESSGSKGTFVVRNYDDYVAAVSTLRAKAKGRSVVVSEFIKGINASVQVCITKYGIFSGGIQYQLIAEKELCNPSLDGATSWCGGEIGAKAADILQLQAHEMATVIGRELESHGYKGIFAIDLMITDSNEVYAIEINARLTGFSHIVADLQIQNNKIPFTLLHILELANIPYEVTDLDALPSFASYIKPATYMIINNPLEEDFILEKEVPSGIYRIDAAGKISLVRPGSMLSEIKREDEFFLYCNKEPGEIIGSGKRIANILRSGSASSSKGTLLKKNKAIIRAIKEEFSFPTN